MTTLELADVDLDVEIAPAGSTAALAAVTAWAQTIASAGTRRAYRAAVLELVAAYGRIDATTLAAWRDQLVAAGLARSTVKKKMAGVRAFTGWAIARGELPVDVAAELQRVQVPKLRGRHAPHALSSAQVRVLERTIGAVWPEDQLRAAHALAAVRILDGCGLRVEELVDARKADLAPARPSSADRAELAGRARGRQALDVEGKGGRRRTVPVPPAADAAIAQLHRTAGLGRAAALIPALTSHRIAQLRDDGRSASSARTIQHLIGRLAAAANELAGEELIPPALAHPHALRHGYALRFIARGGSLARLQQLLGHADVSTTSAYLASLDGDQSPDPIGASDRT